jgi:tRNA pseudouridine32 synthase/23S rRNA pseudouridine746 synthase
MLHRFQSSIEGISLPGKFTYPFCYVPHPLCVTAAKEVCEYLETQGRGAEEPAEGKMLGVLVVRTENGEIGYLAAFSGNPEHRMAYDFFVPPVFDLLLPNGYFVAEEERISRINKQIEEIRNSCVYMDLKTLVEKDTLRAGQEIEQLRSAFRTAKANRDKRRQTTTDPNALADMIGESRFQKAELKRRKRSMQEYLDSLQAQLAVYEDAIKRLGEERKRRSVALQRMLFDSFRLMNAKGEERRLTAIFEESGRRLPPAGAGECAAPRLLQYAYRRRLHPLAMAEFWWQGNPTPARWQSGLSTGDFMFRRHGYFYPACRSKCEPILTFMLQGLEVEDNPLGTEPGCSLPVEIVFEDEWLLVVNKPAGMCSVPGKGGGESVYSRMRERCPAATGPLIVHRLDMDTSGLMIVAKDELIYKELQRMFASRSIEKRYLAVLDGVIGHDAGEISLPLCPDPSERPRQIVHHRYGKPAVTRYKTLRCTEEATWVAFFPLTGRTHQLRVHAAHPEGLNTPVRGDRLYGRPSDRLYLHAAFLGFIHPATGREVAVSADCDFA